MNSPTKENEEVSSSAEVVGNGGSGSGSSDGAPDAVDVKPPAKRPAPAVIEISDTESDDSDICAVTSYQASADEVKRIRGEEYSSSSSSSDYSSDSDSPWEDDSIIIEDQLEGVKAIKAYLNPRANRMDEPLLNENLKLESTIEKLLTHWKERKSLSTEDIVLRTEPFRLCLLHNFLSNSEIINNIVDDMNTLDWNQKKLDLYQFHQTADLSSLTWQRSIKGIYELLKTEVKSWISKVTGLELTEVSASCSLYGPGDRLLVHDDQLGDRRVAFILYLCPWKPADRPYLPGVENGAEVTDVDELSGGWARHMGGSLDLFSVTPENVAKEVVASVLPRNNTLAFFQVGVETYHQVSQVLSLQIPRLSINGWFHGPGPDPICPPEPPLPSRFEPHNDPISLSEFLCGAYLGPRSRSQLQSQTEEHSECSLRSVVLSEVRQTLCDALSEDDIPWETVGPPTYRHCSRIPSTWLSTEEEEETKNPIRRIAHVWRSREFMNFLSDCTGLTLKTHDEIEILRFRPGDYELIPPRSHYQTPRLETVLMLTSSPLIRGGTRQYTAPEDIVTSRALLTVPATDNTLSLVYCDSGAARYTDELASGDLWCVSGTYRE